MKVGKVIFLNGPSSVEKSSIAKTIQGVSKENWLTFEIDKVLEIVPDKCFGTNEKCKEDFYFSTNFDEQKIPITEIFIGDYGKKRKGARW
jgi:chloramphenicol 3-O-phosphotransferase